MSKPWYCCGLKNCVIIFINNVVSAWQIFFKLVLITLSLKMPF